MKKVATVDFAYSDRVRKQLTRSLLLPGETRSGGIFRGQSYSTQPFECVSADADMSTVVQLIGAMGKPSIGKRQTEFHIRHRRQATDLATKNCRFFAFGSVLASTSSYCSIAATQSSGVTAGCSKALVAVSGLGKRGLSSFSLRAG